jgi:2-oxoglutarate dehydrogenase E1 component
MNMKRNSFLGNGEPGVIEGMYNDFLNDPSSVPEDWKYFFEGFDFARKNYAADTQKGVPENVRKEFAVVNLINLYRATGHLFTKTNPVRERRKYAPTLDEIHLIGLDEKDLDTEFEAGEELGLGKAKLSEIIAYLKATYCRSIGSEYMYIRSEKVKAWLKERIEKDQNTPRFSLSEKKHLLENVTKAVVFENFLQTRFPGEKRFSLEGAENLIPAMREVMELGGASGIEEFVIGMAHRGRLNVLANIMGKTYEDIFSEFEGKEFEEALFDGDVKYHQGYSSNIITRNGNKIHLSLTPNPSHLETVGSIVQGITRAKLEKRYDNDENKICPILIHGDAAIAGQGIVYELLQMSGLEAYSTGGTLHLVINNQVGFTTNYLDARTSTYCTDVAKVVLSPVFHVNGDDLEALVHTLKLAMEYRQTFHRDVFIDILCYRKYGHNEGDEPRFTQPLLYKKIASHPNPRQIYLKRLINEESISESEAKEFEQEFQSMLNERLDEARQIRKTRVTSFLDGTWKNITQSGKDDFDKSPETGVALKTLLELGKKITEIPEGKNVFKKTERLFAERRKMITDGKPDWAMAEQLAFASLLKEGFSVRMTGQDVERGTFSQRHAVLTLEDGEDQLVPLKSLEAAETKFNIYNSLLSEYAVLGFEYGYAMASPDSLTVWEAQFGDFGNCAQVIIDQYLSAAEDKWRRMNGICLFLPHGYEGQGAEHSSARIERFLILSAENNMYVVYPTTPANFFHAVRRQLHVPWRKPLVVFTPKSLLRHPMCLSPMKDFDAGTSFEEIYEDPTVKAKDAERVLLCTGKIFYDLKTHQKKIKDKKTAIIRIEQLYPFPKKKLMEALKGLSKKTPLVWVQEEPENMGAWPFMLRTFKHFELSCIARPESASPATGSKKTHEKQQAEILKKAFNYS